MNEYFITQTSLSCETDAVCVTGRNASLHR